MMVVSSIPFFLGINACWGRLYVDRWGCDDWWDLVLVGTGLYGGDERGNGNRMEIVLVCRGGGLCRLHGMGLDVTR